MLTNRVDVGISNPPALCILMSFGNSDTTAPAITGVDNKNEKRVAASRVNPRNNPAVIVIPERETPGHSARAWAEPMATASPIFDESRLRLSFDFVSAH